MSRSARALCPLTLLLLGAGGLVAAAEQAGGASTQPKALEAFTRRVAGYAELRQRLSADLPSLAPTATLEQILEVETILAARLRSARAGAQHGDIVDDAARQSLRALVRAVFDGRRAESTRAAIMDVQPDGIPLRVNATYPKSEPLSTVPPNLLRRLPPLPPAIEFRFVGRHLVLLDVRANLIMDYVRDVIPRA